MNLKETGFEDADWVRIVSNSSFHEHGDEHLNSIKTRGFLGQLNNYQLFMEEYVHGKCMYMMYVHKWSFRHNLRYVTMWLESFLIWKDKF
jgi:hypothetical protein